MSENSTEAAVVRDLRARGFAAMTSEEWTRQGALDILREQRRHHQDTPRSIAAADFGTRLAERLAEHVDVPAYDMASVLLTAGASVAALAVQHGLSGTLISDILQIAADELDQRAGGGDQS